jgi:protein-disulfide isomerase
MTTCRSPGESEKGHTPEAGATNVDLPGIDTSQLTAREKREWSAQVSSQLAPCPDTPVSVAQCVQEKRSCAACVPAAKFLLDQVQKGRTRTQTEAAYRARFAPDQVKPIELMGSPSKGPTDAPVTVVEFADFECPACRAAAPVVDKVLAKHQNDTRLVFKNFPLEIHQNAETAARAAVAADRQGKFWDMHHALFTSEAPLTRGTLDSLAKKLGLDMAQFNKDLESEATADVVARDRKQGEAVHLHATPTIFINGREFNYADDLGTELDAWINLELELLGKPASVPAAAPSAAPAASDAPSAAPAPSALPPKQAPSVPSAAAEKKPGEPAKGTP